MSRIAYADDARDYDVRDTLDQGRFQQNARRVVHSKRGQQSLRDLRAVLRALPEKRLIADGFCVPRLYGDGPVIESGVDYCLLAAYASGKGYTAAQLHELDETLYDAFQTADFAATELAMTATLAWLLIELNDELIDSTPEGRYHEVLRWLDEALAGDHA